MEGDKVKVLQTRLDCVEGIRKSVLEDIAKLGCYVDEDNQIKPIEKVYAISVGYRYHRKYVGEVGWLCEDGDGIVEIPQNELEGMIEDNDSIGEFVQELLYAKSWTLRDLPFEEWEVKGNIEDGTFSVSFDVYGLDGHNEGSFSEFEIEISQVEKRLLYFNEEEVTD